MSFKRRHRRRRHRLAALTVVVIVIVVAVLGRSGSAQTRAASERLLGSRGCCGAEPLRHQLLACIVVAVWNVTVASFCRCIQSNSIVFGSRTAPHRTEKNQQQQQQAAKIAKQSAAFPHRSAQMGRARPGWGVVRRGELKNGAKRRQPRSVKANVYVYLWLCVCVCSACRRSCHNQADHPPSWR